MSGFFFFPSADQLEGTSVQIRKAASATKQPEPEIKMIFFGHNRPHLHAETPKRHVILATDSSHDGEKFCL